MRSKVAKRILDNTPQHIIDEVRKVGNDIIKNNRHIIIDCPVCHHSIIKKYPMNDDNINCDKCNNKFKIITQPIEVELKEYHGYSENQGTIKCPKCDNDVWMKIPSQGDVTECENCNCKILMIGNK